MTETATIDFRRAHRPPRMPKRILSLFCLCVVLGSVAGITFSAFKIIRNHYIQFGMPRLLAVTMQNEWNLFIEVSLATFGGLVLLILLFGSLWKFVLSKAIVSEFREKAVTFYIYAIASLLFICIGFVVNKFWLPYKFAAVSLFIDLGMLVSIAFVAWAMAKILLQDSFYLNRIIIKSGIAFLSLLLIMNTGMWTDGKIKAPQKPNIVWIVIDALRPDHLGCYGYSKATSPFIDQFSKKSILFKNAFAQESYTLASVPSFFTSTYPFFHRVLYDQPRMDVLDSRLLTIAEILREANFQTVALTFNPHLRSIYNFAQGFDLYENTEMNEKLPYVQRFETANKIYTRTQQIVTHRSNRPLFLYLHYRDVHQPYAPPPAFAKEFLEEKYMPYLRILQERLEFLDEEKEQHEALYDAEIRYTDFYVQKMFEMLKSHGINFDNSIFVITADHGDEFYEHGGRGHGRTLYNELIHVPLILSVPGQKHEGRVVQSNVQSIDIAPTILDAVAIDWAKYHQFQGRSLQFFLRGTKESSREVLSGGNCNRIAIIEGEWKYYRIYNNCYKPEEGFQESLFHLTTDPYDSINLIDQEKGIADTLRKRSTVIMKNLTGAKASEVEIDPETREELKSLGYVN